MNQIQIVYLRWTLLNGVVERGLGSGLVPYSSVESRHEGRRIARKPRYDSLEECEIANKKFYGGSGMCHCFPDGIFNRSGDDWRSRVKDYGTPQESLPD